MSRMACPSLEILSAFALGDLPEPDVGAVAEHLDACIVCDEQVTRLDVMADAVISELRRLPNSGLCADGPATLLLPAGSAEPVPAPAPAEVESWGEFRIVRELGRGGMGVVCEAYQGSLNRHVALKFLPENGDLARFRREARAAARLHHTHIVPVFGVGEQAGRHFYVMQYIAGRSLDAVLKERAGAGGLPARFDDRETARIGVQIAEALAHAHGMGVIHRDIKPSNLLLDEQGSVWVTDFGLAHDATDTLSLTQTGDFLGTLRYVAPERLTGRGDERADIYGLGVTLYELLCVRPAFIDRDRPTLLYNILNQDPPRPRQLDPPIARDLETIVLKAMERDPAERYASAVALAEDLHRFLKDEPIVARPVSFWERGRKWARRRPGLAAAVVLVLLLLAGMLGLGGWSYLRISQALARVALERTAALEAARNEAAAHKDTAQANARLQGTREELRQTLYATRSNLALAAWKANDIGQLRFLLDLMQPRPEEPDPRGWEWHYLNRLAHEERLTFGDHDREVGQVAFSPDGRTLASVQWGGIVKLWDPATGKVRLTLQPRQPNTHGPMQSGVTSLAFSPDGERLAGPGPDATLGIWDTRTGGLLLQFMVSRAGTPTVAFSPDGLKIATGSANGKVQIWDATHARRLHDFARAHDHPVQRVVFSPDGRRVASTGGGVIRLWDVETGRTDVAISCAGVEFFGLAFSPDGQVLASGGSDQVVRIWDAGTGRERDQLLRHGSTVTGLAWHPDGRRVASAGADAAVRIWDMSTGRQVGTFKGHTGLISSVAFSPDGNTLASSGFDRTVKLWDAGSQAQPLVLTSQSGKSFRAAPRCLTFSPDSRLIASGHTDQAVRVWEVATGRLRLTLTDSDRNDVTSVAFSPSGQTIASTSDDTAVRLWDVATGQLGERLFHEAGKVHCARFSPDGRRLVSTTTRGLLRVWDLGTSRCVLSIPGQNEARSVEEDDYIAEYTPDGRALAAPGGDSHFHLWDAEDGRHLSTLSDRPGRARFFTFSPGGERIAECNYVDKLVMIRDAATGQLQLVLKGHTDTVDSMAFSPDGRQLVSSGHDQTIRLWDLASGQALLTLKGHSGKVRSVAFSGDGRHIASASDDGTIVVWDASPRAPAPDKHPVH